MLNVFLIFILVYIGKSISSIYNIPHTLLIHLFLCSGGLFYKGHLLVEAICFFFVILAFPVLNYLFYFIVHVALIKAELCQNPSNFVASRDKTVKFEHFLIENILICDQNEKLLLNFVQLLLFFGDFTIRSFLLLLEI